MDENLLIKPSLVKILQKKKKKSFFPDLVVIQYNTIQFGCASNNSANNILFPFSLRDKAMNFLYSMSHNDKKKHME